MQNKIGVIIAAAGKGTRMGSEVPKQFMSISGIPMIAKTYKAFAKSQLVDKIFIVTNEEYMETCKDLVMSCTSFDERKKMGAIIQGGDSRQDSVYRGLKAIKNLDNSFTHVLVHDGARPFVSEDVINRTISRTIETGAAVACVKPKDTIRTRERTLDRGQLLHVQTPQGFDIGLLIESYEKATINRLEGTDDASLVEALGYRVAIVEGDYGNYKVTTPEDIPKTMGVGHGYDVHRLVEGRRLILGGVNIPHEKGLLGHSDADVLTHALMDALLGGSNMGDIGKLFPDTDIKYKDISSMELLRNVGLKLSRKGVTISNVDITVMAQRPKISGYIEAMKKNIAAALGIFPYQVNIKGTTTEKLGFVGREEGIAAEAVCLLNL
ncbi:MAG: 2-C-methyl-D-erythritol 4-phosphate cytidylyltransferase [Anaerovoracaceae bacterium]